jgi:ATP-dependent Clp protease, protease subunit
MDYQIDIDSYISDWGYSQTYVKQMLNKYKGQHVDVRMNSYGGDINNGLGIYQRIADHGNVQVDMFGFCASTATWCMLTANSIRMASNAFYLIHKCSNTVAVWESMNADQLAVLIAELQQNMAENTKVDEVIAQMYATKTGKSIKDILDLMKVGGWMNATDAKEWGFVDEIITCTES